MCVDGNSAPLSVRYINAQLTALWENAQECVKSGGNHASVDIKSEEYDKHKYTRALAEFHLLGRRSGKGPFAKEDLFFDASFDKPRVEFACNHEAVLHLKLKSGHLNKEFKKVKEPGYRLSRSHNVRFDGLEIAFRMRFNRHSIEGKSSRIGNEATIQFMILDFNTAKMVLTRPDRNLSMSHDIQDALEFYMRQYLTFLHGAGAHTLFDLPDFDNDKYSPFIDHSINSTVLDIEELCRDITIFGTSISSINDHLRSAWMKIGSLASGIFGSPPTDHLSTCLYEIKSTWLSYVPSTHFHIKFSPPTVRALCSHEVVVYFTLEELSFYKTGLFNIASGGYSQWEDETKWKIAFIVDVKEVKEADGCVTRLMLDLKSARFSQHLSLFHYQDVEYFNVIVDFMKTTYITLLIDYKFYDIYWVDIRIPGFREISMSDFSDEEWTSKDPVPSKGHDVPFTWSETIEQITLYGFDQVMAISEESINALFRSWWTTASKGSHDHCLWGYSKNHIEVTFRPSRVQLLSGNRAIIWVTIDDGHLLLEKDDRQFDCSGWSMAYEVDIKMVDHHDMKHDAWDDRFKNASVLKHGHHEHRHIRHVIFDFAHAKFSYELSFMEGIFDHGADIALGRLKSMTGAIEQYLHHLTITGHNIIHSVPVFKHAATIGITDISIQVVSKKTVTVRNVSHVHEAPVLLVLGMLGHRPMPTVTVSWGCGWIIPPRRGDVSYGTICLSSRVFLEGRILRLLEQVNRRTTVIPRFPTEEEDEYKVYLTTWDKHRHRGNKECKWSLSNEQHAGWLSYIFEHKDTREYSHEMSGVHPEFDEYSVVCHTRNQLLIPTAYRPGCMDIIMRGHSVLSLRGKSEHNRWSNRTSATWEATISVFTTAHGLRMEVTKIIEPAFEKPKLEGKFSLLDALQLHRQNLPGVIKFDDLLGELQTTLEGEWDQSYPSGTSYTLASPIFTHSGDFVVQVRTQDPHAKPLVIQDRPTPTIITALPAFAPPPLTPSPSFSHGHLPTAVQTPVSAPTGASKSLGASSATVAKSPVTPAKSPVTAAAPVAKSPASLSPAASTHSSHKKVMESSSLFGRIKHAVKDAVQGGHHDEPESPPSSTRSDSPLPVTPAVPHVSNPLDQVSKHQQPVPVVRVGPVEDEGHYGSDMYSALD